MRPGPDVVRTIVLVTLGGALTLAMVIWVGGRAITQDISHLGPIAIASVLMQFLSILLWALRWGLLIRAQGIPATRDVVPMVFTGDLFNNVTPASNTGGEPFRAYILGKVSGVPVESAMAGVVVDRIMDLASFTFICLATFILAALFHFMETPLLRSLTVLGALGSGLICFILIYFSVSKEAGIRLAMLAIDRLSPILKRFWDIASLKTRAASALALYATSVASISGKRKTLVAAYALSLLIWITIVLRTQFVFMALGTDISLFSVNAVAVGSMFSGFLPLLPGGLGTTEATMIALYTSLGVQKEISASATLVDRAISYWLMNLAGGVALAYMGHKYQLLRPGVKRKAK